MDRREVARDSFADWSAFYVDEFGVRPPTVKQVCPTCEGNGRYVNPSIDSHRLTADDFAGPDGEEFAESYFSGAYDVTCGECHGSNVVNRLAVDADPDMRESWRKWQRDMRELDAMYESERRLGA